MCENPAEIFEHKSSSGILQGIAMKISEGKEYFEGNSKKCLEELKNPLQLLLEIFLEQMPRNKAL